MLFLASVLDRKLLRDLWRINRFHWSGRERLRDRLRYAMRTQLSPRLVFFKTVPLPDRLFLFYYPIRWIHDYVLLPIWSLSKRLRIKQ